MQKMYRDPHTGQMLPDRRSGNDRRNPTSLFAFLTSRYRRRRSRGRRATDKAAYVDLFDTRTWGIVIAILILSLFDALLTGLHMIGGSARELNPILNAVLVYGGLPAFFGVKGLLTILPVAIIMIHKEWAMGRYAAQLCLWAYILLSLYHMYLIFGIQKIRGFFLAHII
ncbi:MAG: hypothetical protein JXA73_18895 [Acidobacteria bacterium]|nr:hypothetical protein [Acidobacteriota bacterium]